jgi:hypothetical protein
MQEDTDGLGFGDNCDDNDDRDNRYDYEVFFKPLERFGSNKNPMSTSSTNNSGSNN